MGFLLDPDGPLGRREAERLETLASLASVPCAVLLGETGMGKTNALRVEYPSVRAAIEASGGLAESFDLSGYATDALLAEELFGRSGLAAWDGDRPVTLFLDSLD